MKCLIYFGMSSMKEGTSAQLSGRGELHWGARITTLVTLRKCTLGYKREIKTLKFVSASTKGFKGGLSLDQALQERQGSDFFLLGAFRRCEGRLRSGAVPPPTARPLGGLLGSATHVLWARVCGCGGPTLSPWPACPVGAACRGGGRGPSPGGMACHCCEGRLVSGAVPPPAARPLEWAAGALRPVCPGCGRCGRGDPAPAPQRAPLRAGVARCGGGGWASPGWVPSAVVRGVCGQALPLPRLPAHWACCWGPSPTCRWRGCVGVGAQHCPPGLHALWPCAHALTVLHTLQWHHPCGRALLLLAQAPTQDYHSYTHAPLGGVEDKVPGPNDPPVKETREHSAAKQLWPNRDVTTRFLARAWRGKGAQVGCTARMSMESNCPRHSWLRRIQLIV